MATPQPTGAREIGWLPDLVFTGGRFESGLAFFADALGRIMRFSREPGDLAQARRLNGMAALPGLVDSSVRVLDRVRRGRSASPPKSLGAAEARDVARLAFVEMLLSGVTCAAAFHRPGFGRSEASAMRASDALAREVLRAAHEIGIRVALCPVPPSDTSAEAFVHDMESLRKHIAEDYSGDMLWLGLALERVERFGSDVLKAIGSYAHSQRLRVLADLGPGGANREGSSRIGEQRPLQILAESGLADKRLVVVPPAQVTREEIAQLGAWRAALCVAPSEAQQTGTEIGPLDVAQAAGVTVALGSGGFVQGNLLAEARQLPGSWTTLSSAERATRLFHALTVGGARSLGAPSGALEVGRPADFFTVNVFDPSIAGAAPGELLEAIVFAMERRAVREVWIGGRQRLAGGRHAQQGPAVARFVEVAQRLE